MHEPPRSLTIAIGCFNDGATIRSVVLQAFALQRSLPGTIEVLVIDDGSLDASPHVLEQIAGENTALRFVRLPRHCGYATVVRRGLAEARTDLVFTCPGDGQIAPGVALDLWPHIARGDIVVGHRTPRRDSHWRRLQSLTYRGLLRYLFGLQVKDPNSCKMLRRSVLEHVELRARSAFIEAELLIQARKHGARLIEVPVPHRQRTTRGASGARPRVVLPCLAELFEARFLPRRWARRTPAPRH